MAQMLSATEHLSASFGVPQDLIKYTVVIVLLEYGTSLVKINNTRGSEVIDWTAGLVSNCFEAFLSLRAYCHTTT